MDAYQLDNGIITVAEATPSRSIGTLTLHDGAELDRHNRPVDEQLLQVKGIGGLRIFYEDGPEEITLEEGEHFVVPAGLDHQHLNMGDGESVVMWRFDGDILDIIDDIRDDHDEV